MIYYSIIWAGVDFIIECLGYCLTLLDMGCSGIFFIKRQAGAEMCQAQIYLYTCHLFCVFHNNTKNKLGQSCAKLSTASTPLEGR